MNWNQILPQWFGKPDPPDYKKVNYVESLADIPKHTGTDIYIVSNDGKKKWVVFQCPNGCGKRVEVNLMRSRYPYWTVEVKRKKVSLQPSVVVEGCGAHFFLTKSKIIEAKFSDEY